MYNFKDCQPTKSWDEFIAADPLANFLQASDWSKVSLANCPRVIRGCRHGGKLVAAYLASIVPARRARHMSIAGGPRLDWSNKKLVQATFDDIAQVAKEHNCVFVRIRPQLELSQANQKLLSSLGLKLAPMPFSVEHAGILDLNKSDDQLWANMSQSLRRKIRQAQKQDIKIVVDSKLETAKQFCQLHHIHAARQHYLAFKSEHLIEQFKAFASNDRVKIYSAYHQGQVLSMNMIFFFGPEASYHYGISTDAGTKISAAPLLHLAAISDARQRGITRYNFWGIVPKDQTNHRFYGVSQFKRSFGVEELHYLPAHDLVLKAPAYSLNWLLETIRRRRRKLIR